MNGDLHVNDCGSLFVFTIYDGDSIANLSSFTLFQVILDRPDNTQTTYSASLYTDGTDGKIQWQILTTSTLNVPGWYRAQAFVKIDDTHQWHSSDIRFKVLPNL